MTLSTKIKHAMVPHVFLFLSFCFIESVSFIGTNFCEVLFSWSQTCTELFMLLYVHIFMFVPSSDHMVHYKELDHMQRS